MKLTPSQIDRFHTDGYLFFPAHFSPEEVAELKCTPRRPT
jgi:hypothetical protein